MGSVIMSPKKQTASSKKQTASSSTTRPARDLQAAAESNALMRIPSPARFLLVILSSMLMSSVLFTYTSSLTLGDLGPISKHLEEWWEVGVLIAWRFAEVGVAWVLGFDGRDVASFLFLTHLPIYTLLSCFYGVRPTSSLVSFAITIVSTALPFVALRRPSSVHDLSHTPSGAIANRGILQDKTTTFFTSLLGASIFSVVLYISYASWLPAQLVVHFESLPDISAAHAGPAGLPVLFLTLAPAGWAVRDFLFVSSTGYTINDGQSPSASCEGEYLIAAMYRKTWGKLPIKARILVSRSIILAIGIMFNTVIQVAGTIRDVSVVGAAAWGSVWAVSALLTGASFGWIESVDGV